MTSRTDKWAGRYWVRISLPAPVWSRSIKTEWVGVRPLQPLLSHYQLTKPTNLLTADVCAQDSVLKPHLDMSTKININKLLHKLTHNTMKVMLNFPQ